MITVIFLDIDGVLNRGNDDYTTCIVDPTLVKRFNKIVADTGAYIVLSSAWRNDPNWENNMVQLGIVDEFIGRTPRLKTGRGKEIYAWLKKNPGVAKYAILDDASDLLALQKPHFFKTSTKSGLTEGIANKVTAYLSTP